MWCSKERDALPLATARSRRYGNPGPCPHIDCLWGAMRTPNNSEGNLASQSPPGSPRHKKKKKEQNLKQLQVCWGASKEKFLTAIHERPSVCRAVQFTMISVFLPLEKLFFFSFLKILAFITLTCANTWDAFNVPRQPPLNTVPRTCWRIELLPQDLITPLLISCLIAGRNQNTENIWRIFKWRGKKKERTLIKRDCNKS